ncbi:uncharacterized protein LOC141892448 isoform X5 [Acropora palmata]
MKKMSMLALTEKRGCFPCTRFRGLKMSNKSISISAGDLEAYNPFQNKRLRQMTKKNKYNA